MSKLILTDLDHTILREDGSISDYTLQVLEKCRSKGVLFAIATARYWIGAEKYINLLKPDFEITTDGTLIHSNGECIYSCELSIAETNGIIHEIRYLNPENEITVANGKTVLWNSNNIASSSRLYKATFTSYDKELEFGGNKITVQLPSEAMAQTIASKYNCRLQSFRGENWYAFIPRNSGKIQAIKYMADKSGISIDDIIAFGDDTNDIEMLKLCGKGIAVANAVSEVLDIADETTLSNDEDGVARWLERNMNLK